jgi:hypothetical protein
MNGTLSIVASFAFVFVTAASSAAKADPTSRPPVAAPTPAAAHATTPPPRATAPVAQRPAAAAPRPSIPDFVPNRSRTAWINTATYAQRARTGAAPAVFMTPREQAMAAHR